MPYVQRRFSRKRSGSAELLYLAFVLGAGCITAWWAAHLVAMDLSGVTVAASILGLTETGRVTHGPAGYQANAAQTNPPGVAPFCNPGETPTFAVGLGDLRQQLGDAIGAPAECEHPSSAAGDTIQLTTTGLVAYNHLTDTASFTDGWRHWAMTSRGLVAWEGTDSNPPPANTLAAMQAPDP